MIENNQRLHIKYRPDIDGLRAIAVISVVIFHLNSKWLPGGFVGVDIFFVISGYLITSILYKDCQSDQFSLSRFYQRRIARIFPAFFTVAISTIICASFIYTPQDFASAGANLAATCLSLANIKYMMQGNYFKVSPDAQPFLHYWSLSVEEQFYLIFPIFLFLLFRYGRKYVSKLTIFIGIISFISCVFLTQIKPVWAFYLLPTRAWELITGCSLAIVPFFASRSRVNRYFNYIPTILGLCFICFSFAWLHESSGFPGWKAVIPVMGAMAVILPRDNYDGIVGTWLSSVPMVFIGKVSYTLYLWHWPVFAMVDYRFFLWSNIDRILLKCFLTIMLTIGTYYFVESPLRNFLNRPNCKAIAYASLVFILICCVPLGVTIRRNNYVNATLDDVSQGGLVFEGDQNKPTVVLMGDSNGSMYGKTMKEICAEISCNLTVISVAGKDSLPPTANNSTNSLWSYSLNAIMKIKPDYLFIANAWETKLHDNPARLKEALEQVKPYANKLVLLNQPPILPKVASRSLIRSGARPPFFEDANKRTNRIKINSYLKEFEGKNITVIDVSHYFEGPNKEVLFLDEFGHLLFHDATHLSGYGSDKVYDVLMQQIDKS